ncbi:MAG: methyltransferase domain-containing protein [Acidimicrobiales bacterium]|nr:methyltransferase domain-containing protein [Acidimicrobiales bacterium]
MTAAGHVLRNSGRVAEAEETYREAVSFDTANTAAHHFLGDVLADLGRHDDALSAYSTAAQLGGYSPREADILVRLLHHAGKRDEAIGVVSRWVAMHPDDPIGRHMLAACGSAPTPERADDDYVTVLFDGYAASFDQSLGRLGYRAPELVVDAVGEAVGDARADLRVLDAGCGTGLCGPGLRPFAQTLTGVDLSGAMLQHARERGCYDELIQNELTGYLGDGPDRFDVIASADVLIYFGDLTAVLGAAALALARGGTLVFSVEADPSPEAAYSLQHHGRFAHSREHLRGSIAKAGLDLVALSPDVLRNEGGQPVDGFVVTAYKPRPQA